MKLNMYCFNDLLIYLEENLVFDDKPNSTDDKHELKSINAKSLCDNSVLSEKYYSSEIYYALLKLEEAALIKTTSLGWDKIGEICDISWNGHQYLTNEIRGSYLP